MSYLSLSTWSLHRLLGPLRWTTWEEASGTHGLAEQFQPQELTLLELPGEAASRGYRAIEVCHFHFPSTGEAYLTRLKDAFDAAGLSFDTLLLDYGDLSSANERRRRADIGFVRDWIAIASRCGAKRIRVIGGEAPPEDREALARSIDALTELAAYADSVGVRVVTENFKPLLSTGNNCMSLLEQTGGRVGMITDFGNYHGPAKYADIALTAARSASVHAKPQYDGDGMPDGDEFKRCLNSARAAGFDGAYVLIYDGPGDMWQGLERVRRLVEPYLA